ncbi:DUF4199 domain-containing protein [Glutamicibacter sp. 287]|uniref:DUF4199 domain-containing protein n=1 Tax=unclassified Glutamicibacter TaxID=2627139 RepID=UPI000BB680C1|nr:DUF4199 domain-containing protein [Glutamicibacter sp. BW80]PCC30132.1 hypothetical protein CIK76_03310 [Glutamicibacter sp. BW80]
MSTNDPNQPGQPYDPSAGSGSSNPNPYGENPYGGQPTPYGQPAAQQLPQFQQQGGYAPVQPPAERPKTLQMAFIFIMLAGVLSAVASWLINSTNLFGNMVRSQWTMFEDQMRMQMESSNDAAMNAEIERMIENPDTFLAQITSTMTTFTVVGMFITLIAYFLVGFFVGRGVRAMRIIATILAAISVVGMLISLPMFSMYANAADATMINVVYALGFIAGIVGVVFAWLPASSQYIAQRRQARRAGYR